MTHPIFNCLNLHGREYKLIQEREYEKLKEIIFSRYTLNKNILDFEDSLREVKLPVEIRDEIKIIFGRKKSSLNNLFGVLSDIFFNTNLDGGYYFGGIIKINEYSFPNSLENRINNLETAFKEFGVMTYYELDSEKREIVDRRLQREVDEMIRDAAEYQIISSKVSRLDLELSERLGFKGKHPALRFVLKDFDSYFRSSSIPPGINPENINLLERFPSVKKDLMEYIALEKKLNEISLGNPLISTKGHLGEDGLDITRLKMSELFSFYFGRELSQYFGLPENSFGDMFDINEDVNILQLADLRLDKNIPNVRVITKEWSNFFDLWLINLSSPVTSFQWKFEHQDVLIREREINREHLRKARSLGLNLN
jgi:hypothetical protein